VLTVLEAVAVAVRVTGNAVIEAVLEAVRALEMVVVADPVLVMVAVQDTGAAALACTDTAAQLLAVKIADVAGEVSLKGQSLNQMPCSGTREPLQESG